MYHQRCRDEERVKEEGRREKIKNRRRKREKEGRKERGKGGREQRERMENRRKGRDRLLASGVFVEKNHACLALISVKKIDEVNIFFPLFEQRNWNCLQDKLSYM